MSRGSEISRSRAITVTHPRLPHTQAEVATLGLKAQLNKAPRSWASVSDLPVSVAKRIVALTRDAMALCISTEAKNTALWGRQSRCQVSLPKRKTGALRLQRGRLREKNPGFLPAMDFVSFPSPVQPTTQVLWENRDQRTLGQRWQATHGIGVWWCLG